MNARASTVCVILLLSSTACGAEPRTAPVTPPAADDAAVADTAIADTEPAPDTALPVDPARLTDDADYLVTVRTRGWDVPEGTLSRYRRDAEAWVRDGVDIPIILGRSGVGWGRGIHGEGVVPGHDGPIKNEGDGRSPAGAFWLNHALGYAATAPTGTQIEYQAMTPTLQCIEDTSSAYYNRVVDRALISPDWDSTDRLLRDDGLYEFLVFVNQNVAPAPVPGRGSCILFHVWTSPTTPTAGCTSMERSALESVVQGLAPERNLLVQLPTDVYDALAEAWNLPE